MGKIKKILTTFVVLISIFTLTLTKVDAATGTVTMSANKTQIVVGNTVTFTVKVSASTYLGAFQYNLSYDSSMLTLTSGDASGAPVFTGTEKSKTYTFTFKALKSGTATVKFNISGGYTFGEETLTFSSPSKSVKIITQSQLEASYSSNNNLSSLGVEGYTLSPSFQASVTSYTVNLPANTEAIKITGKKADSTASVEGLGTVTVEDGTNTIKIEVTAQNGKSKTYTITAIVEELDPIYVTVDNNQYTIIRKAKLLTSPNSDFIESTTTINENEIPTLYNEKANITLVGLKDTEGNSELYMYNQENNQYTKYNQYLFSGLNVYIEDKEIENYVKKEELTIDDKTISVYTIENDAYYYFYAINLENGKEAIYRYDTEENTLQRYIEQEEIITEPEIEAEDKQLYQYIIIGLLAFIFLTYIIILINLLCKGKKKKKKKQQIRKLESEEITEIKEPEINEEPEEPTEIEEPEEEIIEEEQLEEETKEIELTSELDDEIIVITEKKSNQVTEKEKKKLRRDSEEELIRISESNPTETNELAETLEKLLTSETKDTKTKKKKKTTKKD